MEVWIVRVDQYYDNDHYDDYDPEDPDFRDYIGRCCGGGRQTAVTDSVIADCFEREGEL